jgi:putative toxin-antitoxin system antitoxin component (TIGR02293 family)
MPTERELVERRARVVATADYVWKSKADAQQFLNTPHSLLDGRTPLDASMTEPGARRVEEWMWRLFYEVSV